MRHDAPSNASAVAAPEHNRRQRRSDPHSFDAWWHDGHWSRSASPGLDSAGWPATERQAPPPKPVPAPSPARADLSATGPIPAVREAAGAERAASDAAGRTFFAVLFCFALATTVELWWLNTPSGALASTSDILIAVGRLTGLIGGFILLFQVLLMSRAGWLERWIGAHSLLIWHRELGGYLLIAVLTHVATIIVGYAQAVEQPLLTEAWSIITTYEDMISGTIATAILVAVGVLAIRAVRRLISYELWYYLHLTSYLVLLLGYGHQFATGQEFMSGGFPAWYWACLYFFVVACLVWGRAVGPLLFNARHRLKVVRVVAESADMVSIYIGGRHLERIRARAGQYFRWRFLTSGCWWQAHPFSLSAAPNHEWLRLTVKVVGDHTEQLQFLEPGVRVFAEGPSGVFTADRRVQRRALLIAGGSGIAPIRALLEDLPPGTVMIYRAGRAEEIVFRQELDWLARERGATVWYVLGGRDEPGPRHLFTPKGLRELVADVRRRDVYLCGPPGLVAVSKDTLKRLRVPRRQLHMDPFEF